MERLSDPNVAIPLGAMAVIIFAAVFRVLGDIEVFRGAGRLPVAVCVTLLAVMGLDRALITLVINHYVAMGVAILIGVATLIRVRWAQIERNQKP